MKTFLFSTFFIQFILLSINLLGCCSNHFPFQGEWSIDAKNIKDYDMTEWMKNGSDLQMSISGRTIITKVTYDKLTVEILTNTIEEVENVSNESFLLWFSKKGAYPTPDCVLKMIGNTNMTIALYDLVIPMRRMDAHRQNLLVVW